ncbi:MAG: hypothetical protein JWN04_4220, partial [Myxococcaceae bacterium]|nr:hypothetical protein [Myxococcaceae bacterium]
MKSIATLDEGQYEVEFVREESRRNDPSTAATATEAGAKPKPVSPLSRCVLRVVGTDEDLEDTSRATAASAPGTKFIATVTHGLRYAAFKPVGAPATDPAQVQDEA